MKCFYILLLIVASAYAKEICETCIHKDNCPILEIMNDGEQHLWIEKLSCSSKRDYICCDPERFLNTPGKVNFESNTRIYGYNLRDQLRSNNVHISYTGQKLSRYPRSHSRNTHWNERPGSNQWRNQNNDRDNRNYLPEQPDNSNRNPGYPTRNNWSLNNNMNSVRNPILNSNKSSALGGQCNSRSLTSLTPEPESGCCGRQASDDDRITAYSTAPANNNRFLHTNRLTRAADVEVTIDNRIAGGSATELYEYPWTVLLLTLFEIGSGQTGFNCGGSLINSQFVLSAAHCITHKTGVRKTIQATLAEYDKRSFPRDCKGSRCVQNIVMYASKAVIHPQFNYDSLVNDISLIRLNGVAPFNEYIRPICLPKINIDDPRYTNLQFKVTGWGLNVQMRSFVKQATNMHLVDRKTCKRSYSGLTAAHLCAIGYKGEDTCTGDSGGPLMMLYRGRYYVMGIVSGKRNDIQCGSTTVPSLYTNVYYYLDWIRNNMKNLM